MGFLLSAVAFASEVYRVTDQHGVTGGGSVGIVQSALIYDVLIWGESAQKVQAQRGHSRLWCPGVQVHREALQEAESRQTPYTVESSASQRGVSKS